MLRSIPVSSEFGQPSVTLEKQISPIDASSTRRFHTICNDQDSREFLLNTSHTGKYEDEADQCSAYYNI